MELTDNSYYTTEVADKEHDDNTGLILLLGGSLLYLLLRSRRQRKTTVSDIQSILNTVDPKDRDRFLEALNLILDGEDTTGYEDILTNYGIAINQALEKLLDYSLDEEAASKATISPEGAIIVPGYINLPQSIIESSESLIETHVTKVNLDQSEANKIIESKAVPSAFYGGNSYAIRNIGGTVNQVYYTLVKNEFITGYQFNAMDIAFVEGSGLTDASFTVFSTKPYKIYDYFNTEKGLVKIYRGRYGRDSISAVTFGVITINGIIFSSYVTKETVKGKRKYGFCGPRKSSIVTTPRYTSSDVKAFYAGSGIVLESPGLCEVKRRGQ